MEEIDSITNAVITVLGAGASFRIIYCLICAMSNPDEAEGYKKKAKNTIVFTAIAVGAFALKAVAIGYFK